MVDPKFIPLAGSSRADDEFQKMALGLRARRQSLLASNIANADTPNYKAVDLNFQEALRSAQARAEHQGLSLQVTAAAHIAAKAAPSPDVPNVMYRVPLQPAADGNTVEMDTERAQFAENAMHYEFSLQYVSNDFKEMLQLFNNLK